MKPNRVPADLVEAGFDAIRAWYAAHPGPNDYLNDRAWMRIALAAALTLHNEQVEQPLRERAETAERELAELRERVGTESFQWGVQGTHGTFAVDDEAAARWHTHSPTEPMTAVRRLVGEWKVPEWQTEERA